ncbi:MAG TPA: glutathione binding-like protein, partial [Alphaproteobacteria bacterium]|nr:glutathione binding-like protein [Alphaproteobacteria bacterium]
EIERRRGPGYAALDVMEGELSVREFFAGAFSIADIALYAYTHVAHEGGFNLDNYPAIRAWIQRIEAIPGYVPLA